MRLPCAAILSPGARRRRRARHEQRRTQRQPLLDATEFTKTTSFAEVMNIATETTRPTDTEQWIAQLDPADPSVKVRDGRYLRHVRETADTARDAQEAFYAAVTDARAHGESWATIGNGARSLKTSRAAAIRDESALTPRAHLTTASGPTATARWWLPFRRPAQWWICSRVSPIVGGEPCLGACHTQTDPRSYRR